VRRAALAFFFCVAACRQQDQPNAQMRAVLDELKAVAPVPIEQLSPQAARQQASLADAVRAVATKQGKTFPEPIVRSYDEGAGDVSVRIYQPTGERPFPVVFYIHGGGWVVGTLDS